MSKGIANLSGRVITFLDFLLKLFRVFSSSWMSMDGVWSCTEGSSSLVALLRVWGLREKLFERALPLLSPMLLDELVQAASVCDGLVKGLKHPDWPADAWAGLRTLVLMLLQPLARSAPARAPLRLALRGQGHHRATDFLPINHDDRKNGAGLDGDVKHLGFFIVKTQQGTRQNKVTGGRDGQKFGQTFDHTHDSGFQKQHEIHGVSF